MGTHRFIVTSALLSYPLLAHHVGPVVVAPGSFELLVRLGQAPLIAALAAEQSRERARLSRSEILPLRTRRRRRPVTQVQRRQLVAPPQRGQIDPSGPIQS
jgi:hypothetical protein